MCYLLISISTYENTERLIMVKILNYMELKNTIFWNHQQSEL